MRRRAGRCFAGRLLLATAAAALAGCSTLARWLPEGPPPSPSSAAVAAPSSAVPWGTPMGAVAAPAAVAVPAAPVPNPAGGVGVPAASAGASVDASFRLGPEDAVEIAVWKDDALKATVLVRPDGAISFPLVGEIAAAGRTLTEVREEIVRRLARFVPDPEVSVTLTRAASYRVYVLGRVNRPGDFVVGRPLDVLQALSLAGGTTPFAREDEIRIVRRVEGRPQSLPFDLRRLRREGDLSQNIVLRSGDVLFVP